MRTESIREWLEGRVSLKRRLELSGSDLSLFMSSDEELSFLCFRFPETLLGGCDSLVKWSEILGAILKTFGLVSMVVAFLVMRKLNFFFVGGFGLTIWNLDPGFENEKERNRMKGFSSVSSITSQSLSSSSSIFSSPDVLES